MTARFKALALQAGYLEDGFGIGHWDMPEFKKYTELLKQAIYDEVKQELLHDEDIDQEPDIEDRCYLRGCNGGIVDALCIIRNFGVVIDE